LYGGLISESVRSLTDISFDDMEDLMVASAILHLHFPPSAMLEDTGVGELTQT